MEEIEPEVKNLTLICPDDHPHREAIVRTARAYALSVPHYRVTAQNLDDASNSVVVSVDSPEYTISSVKVEHSRDHGVKVTEQDRIPVPQKYKRNRFSR